MTARSMNPPGLHRPIGCYSQVTRIGSMVATAGMAAIGLDGKVVGEGDIRAQTRQTKPTRPLRRAVRASAAVPIQATTPSSRR